MHTWRRRSKACRNIFTASEALLKTPGELVEGYQEEATTHGYYVAAPCCLPFSRSTALVLAR